MKQQGLMKSSCYCIVALLCLSRLCLAFNSPSTVPSVAIEEKCPTFRMALINGVNFHFEVLSGLLHVLRPYHKYIDVFLSPHSRTANFDGAWDLVRWSKVTFRKTDVKPGALKVKYDIVILVSPDYELETNEALVQQMQPKLLICIVHNSDFKDMDRLLQFSDNMELLSLAPHAAASLAKYTKRKTDWMLSVYPVPIADDCKDLPADKVSVHGAQRVGAWSHGT